MSSSTIVGLILLACFVIAGLSFVVERMGCERKFLVKIRQATIAGLSVLYIVIIVIYALAGAEMRLGFG